MEKRGSSIIALIAPAVVIIPESRSSTELNCKLLHPPSRSSSPLNILTPLQSHQIFILDLLFRRGKIKEIVFTSPFSG
jgi:hypothetical protein